MEQGCACAQGQRTCTARRAGTGVDKGLSAIPLRCHPERSDTLKGTRGSRAPGKTLTFTDGPLHLRTGFFVACAPQNDRKRARFVESRLACVCGRSAFPPPRHAKQALRPVRHASLREMPPCPRGAALYGITPCMPRGRGDIFFASLCRDMCGAHARHSSLRRYLPCSAALYSCEARSFSAWAAVISGSMTSSRPPFKIASRW